MEIGTLSVSLDAEGASYRLISGGNNNFKIIGDKLILDKGASLTAGSYDLTVGVTRVGGEEVEKTLSVSVTSSEAEKRVISTRTSYKVGETVSFPTENLVSHVGNLEDISWVSIGSDTGGGTSTNTGIITLHYRITDDGRTYDRFHEIDIVHDCESAHCTEFVTSMDTQNDFVLGQHFDTDNFQSWTNFFAKERAGTGIFQIEHSQGTSSGGGSNHTSTSSADFRHSLSINFDTQSGALNSEGTFDGVYGGDFNINWAFDFQGAGSPCTGSQCNLALSGATGPKRNLTEGPGNDSAVQIANGFAQRQKQHLDQSNLAALPDGASACSPPRSRKTIIQIGRL